MNRALKLAILIIVVAAMHGCQSASAPAASPAEVLPSMAPTAAATATPPVTPLPSPTPEPTEPPGFEFTFNPYVMPSDARDYLGDAEGEYRGLVDAVLARRSPFAFSSNEAMRKCVGCLVSEFPLSGLLQYDFPADDADRDMDLLYRYDAREHAARVEAFRERVWEAVVSSVRPGYNELENTLALYRFTATSIAYKDGDDLSAYNALMNGTGICQSYDRVYRFLLGQVGVETLSGGAFMADDAAHAWTLVLLDGQWFHMDATFENGLTAGQGLGSFGMDDGRRLASGALEPFTAGVDEWWGPAPACADGRFAVFAGVVCWEQDEAPHRIALYYPDSAQPLVFDTEACRLLE